MNWDFTVTTQQHNPTYIHHIYMHTYTHILLVFAYLVKILLRVLTANRELPGRFRFIFNRNYTVDSSSGAENLPVIILYAVHG